MITHEPAKDLIVREPPKAPQDATPAGSRKETAQKSCAHWSALLAWAREERGPQFDSSTALYMVDRNSYEGTAYVEPVPKTDEQLAAEARAAYSYGPSTRSHVVDQTDSRILKGDAYAKAFSDASDGEDGLAYVPRPTRSRARYA